MKYFIFRNNTIENLFDSHDVEYSDYDNISFIPTNVDSYIWFYQVPVKSDTKVLSEEISSLMERFRFICSKISANKIGRAHV